MATCEWCNGTVGLGKHCGCYTVDSCTKHPAIINMQAEIDRLREALTEIRDDPILSDYIDTPMRRVINRALQPNV